MTEKVKFKIQQGATFRYDIRCLDELGAPIDISDATAKLQFRKTVDDSTVLLELTTENGGLLKYDPIDGVFRVYISDESTTAITWLSSVFDMKVTLLNGDSFRPIEGSASLSKQVTR